MRTPPRLIRVDNEIQKTELTTKRGIVTIATQELHAVELSYSRVEPTLVLCPSIREGPEVRGRVRSGGSTGRPHVLELRRAGITRFGGQGCRRNTCYVNGQTALLGHRDGHRHPQLGDYSEARNR